MNTTLLIAPIILSIVIGLLLMIFGNKLKIKGLVVVTLLGMGLVATLTILNIQNVGQSLVLFDLLRDVPIYLKLDKIGVLFSLIITLIWSVVIIYSYEYLKNNDKKVRYFGFYFMVYGILIGTHYSGNIVTLYLFYELLTILSAPLVLHNQTREAKMAALKYLFYSFCGAYMILFGIFFVNQYASSLEFSLSNAITVGNETILLIAVFIMIIGFGVKAGLFPFHAWLWAAHPVAPAPASAVLSSVIVKTGILGIIRVIYYVVGTKFIEGTWVQTTLLIFAIITIFMGSMLAYREDVLKKRLAYSTISQLSYILFGLFLFEDMAYSGAILHIASHAMIKCALFLVAGVIIHQTNLHKVSELDGIGKKMPITMFAFTLASLGLIGIPPTGGFISKWYLAIGALQIQNNVLTVIGVVVLLISALLTAGYLLPISIRGFFVNDTAVGSKSAKCEPSMSMLIPIIILVIGMIVIGIAPEIVLGFIG